MKKIFNAKILNKVKYILWSITIFSYFFQFPFAFLSKLIVPSLILYILLEIPSIQIKMEKKVLFLIIIYYLYLSMNAVYALYQGIEFLRVVRFYVILSFIPICMMIRKYDFKFNFDIFTLFSIIKSVLLITIAIYLLMKGDHSIIRNWAINNNFGDIYILNGIPKVQVQGNSLILVAFFINNYNLITTKDKKYFLSSTILILGVLVAGNFAYILGIAMYGIYFLILFFVDLLKKKKIKVKNIIFILLLISIILAPYINKKIIEKSAKSNRVRMEQIEVLLDDNLLIGNGLGNPIIAETSQRTYDGDMYFELQSFYILNQIGIIGMILFYAIVLVSFFKLSRIKGVLYLIYLCYSFWNPYCFDSTQMIATLLIINLKGDAYYEKSDYNIVLPDGK